MMHEWAVRLAAERVVADLRGGRGYPRLRLHPHVSSALLSILTMHQCTSSITSAVHFHFLLPTSYFPLPTAYFLLPTSYFLLPTSYFLLPTPYFLLPTSYFLLTPVPQNYQLAEETETSW